MQRLAKFFLGAVVLELVVLLHIAVLDLPVRVGGGWFVLMFWLGMSYIYCAERAAQRRLV